MDSIWLDETSKLCNSVAISSSVKLLLFGTEGSNDVVYIDNLKNVITLNVDTATNKTDACSVENVKSDYLTIQKVKAKFTDISNTTVKKYTLTSTGDKIMTSETPARGVAHYFFLDYALAADVGSMLLKGGITGGTLNGR